jgi:hypothetical protein
VVGGMMLTRLLTDLSVTCLSGGWDLSRGHQEAAGRRVPHRRGSCVSISSPPPTIPSHTKALSICPADAFHYSKISVLPRSTAFASFLYSFVASILLFLISVGLFSSLRLVQTLNIVLVSLTNFLLHFRYVPMKKITCIKGISEQKVHTVLPPFLGVLAWNSRSWYSRGL